MEDIFELRNVTFAHHINQPPVLEDFSIRIARGSRTAILGPNGAGKTTLFYTLTGVYKPQRGEVLHKGEQISYTRDGLSALRSDVAVVLQNPDEQMFCSLVEEDVAFGPLNVDMDRDEVEARVTRALRDVRMSEYARRPLQQLSEGQRKRVAIAGALAMRPEVLIMDEPTAGLDPQASMEVMELAERLCLEGVTVLISTHDVDLAYSWADRVAVLRKGRLAFDGTSEDFYSDLENVYSCGLLRPSVYAMNSEVSEINGIPPSPYPRRGCEFAAKFGRSTGAGRILCVPCDEDDALMKYDSAVADMPGARIGIYGSDTRYALRDRHVDFGFDGIDACFYEAVTGRDSVLVFDSVYEPVVRRQCARMKEFGLDVTTEGI